MDHGTRGPAALLALVVSCPVFGLSQDEGDKAKKSEAAKTGEKGSPSTASLKVLISADGKHAIPEGSKIQWEGIGDSCRQATGLQNLRHGEPTPVSLPVCAVKITVFVTGFNAQAVTVDLVGNEAKYGDPIHITLKMKGPAEVNWTHKMD